MVRLLVFSAAVANALGVVTVYEDSAANHGKMCDSTRQLLDVDGIPYKVLEWTEVDSATEKMFNGEPFPRFFSCGVYLGHRNEIKSLHDAHELQGLLRCSTETGAAAEEAVQGVVVYKDLSNEESELERLLRRDRVPFAYVDMPGGSADAPAGVKDGEGPPWVFACGTYVGGSRQVAELSEAHELRKLALCNLGEPEDPSALAGTQAIVRDGAASTGLVLATPASFALAPYGAGGVLQVEPAVPDRAAQGVSPELPVRVDAQPTPSNVLEPPPDLHNIGHSQFLTSPLPPLQPGVLNAAQFGGVDAPPGFAFGPLPTSVDYGPAYDASFNAFLPSSAFGSASYPSHFDAPLPSFDFGSVPASVNYGLAYDASFHAFPPSSAFGSVSMGVADEPSHLFEAFPNLNLGSVPTSHFSIYEPSHFASFDASPLTSNFGSVPANALWGEPWLHEIYNVPPLGYDLGSHAGQGWSL